jgi:glycosyltransferase involved in cell wall biosynthesis
MLVARFQKDNKIEMALDGYVRSGAREPFLVIGGHSNAFGSYLKTKYRDNPAIRFVGGVYDYIVLSSLRWYAKQYFHVHSCGGTNPSLLEAMASNAFIAAYNNVFNRHVLREWGCYFSTEQEVADIIRAYTGKEREVFARRNREQIAEVYRWDKVTEQYLQCFADVMAKQT